MPDTHPADSHVFPVRPEIAAHAHVNAERYHAMYRACRSRPRRVLGGGGEAHRLDEGADEDQEHQLRRRCLDQVVRGRHLERLGVLPRSAPGDTRRPDRDHLGKRRSLGQQARHLPGTARPGVPAGQRDEDPRRRQGRPRHHLSADGARGGGGDAGLRADRRDPFGGVRRLLPRQPGQSPAGLRVHTADHRRRGPPRRAQGGAQGQCRPGAEVLPRA